MHLVHRLLLNLELLEKFFENKETIELTLLIYVFV
jgi:hypothetical protein